MEWILGVVVLGVAFYWFVIRKNGNLEFWQTAARHPDEAMLLFSSRDCFFVDIGMVTMDKRGQLEGKWHGPFIFKSPSLSFPVGIYGRAPDYLNAHQEFLQRFKK